MVSHVTLLKRDMRYDHEIAQATLLVQVHFRDGRTVDTALVLDPSQMQMFSIQIEKAIEARQDARSKGPR